MDVLLPVFVSCLLFGQRADSGLVRKYKQNFKKSSWRKVWIYANFIQLLGAASLRHCQLVALILQWHHIVVEENGATRWCYWKSAGQSRALGTSTKLWSWLSFVVKLRNYVTWSTAAQKYFFSLYTYVVNIRGFGLHLIIFFVNQRPHISDDLFPESVSTELCSTFAFMDKPTFPLVLNLNLFFLRYMQHIFSFSVSPPIAPIENSHKTWWMGT